MQTYSTIFKSAVSIIEKQKAHGLSKTPSKGSGDENKTNAFLMLIEEQRHLDFLHV